MRVVVVGLGYVGSVCSACLAKHGHHVVGVDSNPYKVECFRRGESPIVEKDLPELMAAARAAGRLEGTPSLAEASGSPCWLDVASHTACQADRITGHSALWTSRPSVSLAGVVNCPLMSWVGNALARRSSARNRFSG